ncbi:putative MFS transporter [Aspergillus clavatus NRRL 1]|uniref:MFS transporter, putative n=1 Tax=Aspergillus clavatus (strain ATCC 1007 / CBS 513.65 / DSM 816 / NCTC 3887 / NRRL 1 / QM 1276 / 107) TaxID=344612 RepID=A1C5A2_ASPCL|nr:MFS transporter, putative [Aspergillus clavatus NRRL 1]EAW14870.1 MFS transporter, putative [Aspergillus clavatus NRRL 1]
MSSESHSTSKAVRAESIAAAAQDRETLPSWKWNGSLAVVLLTCLIHGYDVSNVANIQPHLYEAFGDIKLLPWIALSYTLAVFAVLSLSRKIIYCFNLRWIYIVCIGIFLAGAAIGGSAHSMSTVIVGRIVMGIGGAMIYQTNLTFVSVFATPSKTQLLIGGLSVSWAVGLIVGGPIGAALAENPDTTWRWAFYMNLPWMGLALVGAILCFPSIYLGPNVPLHRRILDMDPVGIAFNMACPVLFSLGLEFSGPVWAWGSGPSIAVWAIFGVVLAAWMAQQYFCIFTTAEQRAIPVHLMPRLDLVSLWLASGCAGVAYAITLYYVPLFFAFARGYDALQQTVRTLPFILVFIGTVILIAGVLPIIGRYGIVYQLGGMAMLAGAGAMAASLSPTTSESHVMGFEALIGIGLGFTFQHGVGISNVINKSARDRVDSATLLLMAQMGAIAISLSIAGSIFQNVGESLLAEALGDRGVSQEDIRQALAGVSSSVWGALDSEALERALGAVTHVLALEFYLVVAAGALCVVCGGMMGWKKLDYQRERKESTLV